MNNKGSGILSIDNLSTLLETKHFDYQTIEEQIREYWQINKIFQLDTKDLDLKEIKIIDTPPPYANGALHHGHGMSYTQLDIIARYLRMRGPTLLPLAFDDNGLPTERFTEKKYGIEPGQHPDNFFELCKQEAEGGIRIQQQQFDKLGFSYNHQISYRTIDDRTIRITQLDFLKLYELGHLIRSKEPQLYCTRCQTALAQADLENLERSSEMHYINFPDQNGSDILIGTTRPELIPAAIAIFYHTDDNRYQFDELVISNPITGDILPLMADDRIDPEEGTGLMMCATFGDQTDIELYREYQLENRTIIDDKGLITYGKYDGLSIMDARKRILEDLKDEGFWKKSESITQTIPTCERCSTPMEIIESDQWSIDILSIKDELLDYIDQIDFHPSYMKKRLINWISGLKWNWTISRQRFYGIPIPTYHCLECGHIDIAAEDMLPILPGDTAMITCSECGGDSKLDPDIFDTWMASSLTPRILHDRYFDSPELSRPLAFRTQAHEIIRTWAFYTIIKQYLSGNKQTIPWQNLLISGWGLGFKGKGKRGIKASKSSGSGKDPSELIDSYGADAFRYWAASAKLGKDQYLHEAILNRGKKLTTKLYNAAKITFILLYQAEKSQNTSSSIIKLLSGRLKNLEVGYEKAMKGYDYSDALAKLEDTFWNGFCSEDIEHFKSKAYDTGLSDKERSELLNTWKAYLQLFAPFMPFIAEYLWYLTWQFCIQDGEIEFKSYTSLHQSC